MSERANYFNLNVTLINNIVNSQEESSNAKGGPNQMTMMPQENHQN
jgi:hypothetical protein